MIAVSARRLVLHGSRHMGAHAVKLDAAADAAVLDIAAAADSRLPLVRHGLTRAPFVSQAGTRLVQATTKQQQQSTQ